MDWRKTRVAADRTHHVIDGAPLYPRRFREVLKFHEPGLAPALDHDGATHIDASGSPVYARRYVRTFGFYEGLAAVQAEEGWHHVHPDGRPLGTARYAWCGNFQGGRCAARAGGKYLHIDATGEPAYAERYCYAGDFRDDTAVVQREDGLHTHIDPRGRVTHGVWFLDLDVFHKGYARARDDGGWHHVDEAGHAAYERRFAAVEPFYNGQARVERFDAALEVIDERGEPIVQLRPARRSAFDELSADLVGFWRTHVMGAAVRLGVFEALPGSSDEVAVRCGLPSDRAHRLLRALGELRLVLRRDGTWLRTERGELLSRDHPLTLADAAIEYADRFSRDWSQLADAVRGGGAWRAGRTFGAVADEGAEAVARHHRMLASYAAHDYRRLPELIGGVRHLIDAGGGVGVASRSLLARHDGLRVTLLDRPEVLARVAAPQALQGRLELRAVDLLGEWSVQGDAVLLARVLHDWDDPDAARILRSARAALPVGGRLYVVEMLAPERSFGGSLCDLHLLVVHGGRERTLREYRELLSQAGFELEGVDDLGTVPSLIRAVAR